MASYLTGASYWHVCGYSERCDRVIAIPSAIRLTIVLGASLKSVGHPNPTAENADLGFVTSTYEHKITSQVERLHLPQSW